MSDTINWLGKSAATSGSKCGREFNARILSPELIGTRVQLAVVDVSFISLTLVLPPIFACVEKGGMAIALIKPQFELEPNQVGKGGIVREEHLRVRCVSKIQLFVVEQLHREWLGVIESPITGAKGNREYSSMSSVSLGIYAHWRKPGAAASLKALLHELSCPRHPCSG